MFGANIVNLGKKAGAAGDQERLGKNPPDSLTNGKSRCKLHNISELNINQLIQEPG
jgi:hypothetical protein